jgi:hypothetical protein
MAWSLLWVLEQDVRRGGDVWLVGREYVPDGEHDNAILGPSSTWHVDGGTPVSFYPDGACGLARSTEPTKPIDERDAKRTVIEHE